MGGMSGAFSAGVRVAFLVVTALLLLMGSASLTYALWAIVKHHLYPVWRGTFSSWMIIQFVTVGCSVLLAGFLGLIHFCKESMALVGTFAGVNAISLLLTSSLLVLNYLSVQERTDLMIDTNSLNYEMRSQRLFFSIVRTVGIIVLALELLALLISGLMMANMGSPRRKVNLRSSSTAHSSQV